MLFSKRISSAETESQSPKPQVQFVFKFLLVGDAKVGKTSILQRYIHGKFDQEYKATVGGDFQSKYVEVDYTVNAKLQIWDIAGQEVFVNIARSFYKGAHAVFLVYDTSNRETFENVKQWKEELSEHVDSESLYILVGNKAESDDRKVTYEEAVEFIQGNGIHFFFETSASSGANIELAFKEASKFAYFSHLRSNLQGETSIFDPKQNDAVSLTATIVKMGDNNTKSCSC